MDEESRPSDAPSEDERREETPFLPASFFSKLVHQPKCLTEGVCNNCGRCEH